jgi:hypothetical protein
MIVLPPKDDYRVTIDKILSIGSDLDIEFRRQAGLYGRTSWYSSAAKRRVRHLKNQLEVITSKIRRKIRLRYRATRMTKDAINDMVIRKKAYVKVYNELEEAIHNEEIITGMLRALEHKKDMLVGLGANYRHQMPEELRLLSDELKKRLRPKKGK